MAEQLQPAGAGARAAGRPRSSSPTRRSRRGLEATDEEVRRAILEIPGVKDDYGAFVGEEAYQRVLRGNGYTRARLRGRAARGPRDRQADRRLLDASVAVSRRRGRAHLARAQREAPSIRYVLAPPAPLPARGGADPGRGRRPTSSAHATSSGCPTSASSTTCWSTPPRRAPSIDDRARRARELLRRAPDEFTQRGAGAGAPHPGQGRRERGRPRRPSSQIAEAQGAASTRASRSRRSPATLSEDPRQQGPRRRSRLLRPRPR